MWQVVTKIIMINFKKIAPVILAGVFLAGCSSNNKQENNNQVTPKEIKTISLEDFKKSISDTNYQIVDTRDDSLFNGFTNGEIKLGGHIKNAIQYSASFVGKVSEKKLSKYIQDKGIDLNKKIVLYDTDKDNLDKVAKEFSKVGYEVYKFEDYKTYANDVNNKDSIEYFEKFSTLVSPTWLQQLLSGKKPETYNNENYKVFEVSWGETDKSKSYNDGHIKGSYHFNTDWIEEGPIWNLKSAEEIKNNLLKQGITKDTTVILYSDDASAALRVNWALKWAGVEDVRVLNGGLNAWKEIGGEIEKNVNVPQSVEDFGISIPVNPEYAIERASEAYEKSKNENLKLVSIRSWDEYLGNTSGYDYIEKAGEPKGAIFGFSGTSASNMDDYYDPDGTLRNPQEIYNLWENQGIKSNDKIALYCGTGWRNSIPWFMTQLTGRPNTYFYDGGWNDWQLNNDLPIDVNKDKGEKPDSKNDYK